MQAGESKAKDEKRHAEKEYSRVLNQLEANKKQQEQEVMLRLRFEEKLNNLHSLNRTFQQLAQKNKQYL